MATSTSTSSITLKLLIDTKNQRVFFVEAVKDFTDFLFTLLSLPLGTLIRLLSINCMDTLLKPISLLGGPVTLLSLTNDTSSDRKFYICGLQYSTLCPNCNRYTSTEVTYIESTAPPVGSSGEGGFVKGVVTYMIMDDLEVKPMSTICSIPMLNKFNVKEVGALEERTVSLGMDEGLKLLKASLQTKNVLTYVFLGQ
ncbi:hypothetical protein UlMin_025716 [Ulmus minor]